MRQLPENSEIHYDAKNLVGHLSFPVYNGSMDLLHCQRLLAAYEDAVKDPETRVVILWGGADFFSNGIDLNSIHHGYNPAIQAYKNLKAMNRVVQAILETSNKLVLAALQGPAAAGGVMLALAADLRYARDGIVLNPSYVNMGLSGSEYWSILLPSLVGYGRTQQLIYEATPISCRQAVDWGLLHEALNRDPAAFCQEVTRRAEHLARGNIEARLCAKSVLKAPLISAMKEQVRLELEAMKQCCNHAEFEQSRSGFVMKTGSSPLPLAAMECDD
ncbi:MAG: enoyl-CoA hydratase/isomerase family protein [SAR324 cluster bacterium]|nr:enoyl-CoA hydratase/isomerase family protein [SAR324 cluster bacterium]